MKAYKAWPRDPLALSAKHPKRDALVQLVSDEWATAQELAWRAGCSAPYAQEQLHRLAVAGVVQRRKWREVLGHKRPYVYRRLPLVTQTVS